MKTLFNAMESLEIKDDKSLEVLETEMSAMQAEYDVAVKEMDTMELESSELTEAVEQINQLAEIIKEHGLSRSMVAAIEAIEPNFSSYKLFPALEDLNELPTKDAQSELAIEGMKDMAKKAGEAIVKFFKWILNQLQKIFGMVMGIFNSNKKIIIKYKALFKDITLNVEKCKETKIQYFKKVLRIQGTHIILFLLKIQTS